MTGLKRKRGGQWRIEPEVTAGRAYDFSLILKQIWGYAGDAIVNAKSADDVIAALDSLPCFRERLTVGGLPELTCRAVTDRDFPKVRPHCQIQFIAAAFGSVCIAQSRQVCRMVRKQRSRQDLAIQNDPDDFL